MSYYAGEYDVAVIGAGHAGCEAVEEFLKKYEITPKNQTEQSINNQNSEEKYKRKKEI